MKRKSLELDVIWRLKLGNLLKVRDLLREWRTFLKEHASDTDGT